MNALSIRGFVIINEATGGKLQNLSIEHHRIAANNWHAFLESNRTRIPVLKVPVHGEFYTHQRFNRLRVIAPTTCENQRGNHYECVCDCGNTKIVRAYELKNNKIQSCGCLRRETQIANGTTHGLSHTKEYNRAKTAWRKASIIQRTPQWADRERITKIYEACPSGHHVDHIVPLHGEIVSGLHVPDNLQYLPAVENIRKGRKYEHMATN